MGHETVITVENLRSEVLNALLGGSLEQVVESIAVNAVNRSNADSNNAAKSPGLRSQIIGMSTHSEVFVK